MKSISWYLKMPRIEFNWMWLLHWLGFVSRDCETVCDFVISYIHFNFTTFLLSSLAATMPTIASRDHRASIQWSKPFGILLHALRCAFQMHFHHSRTSSIRPDLTYVFAMLVLMFPPSRWPRRPSNTSDPISKASRSTTTHR